MKSRLYYIILAVSVIAVFAGAFAGVVSLCEISLGSVMWILELALLLVLLILFILYRRFVRPLEIIGHGVGLLKEQDFSSRLRHVGQKDADGIVDMFNAMMSRLKQEKIHLVEQERFLSQIVEASPLGIMLIDTSGRISQMNPAMARFLGEASCDAFVGRMLSESDNALLCASCRIPDGADMVYRTEGQRDIYKITSASFMDRGVSHRFYLFERMTDEIFNAEKNAWRKVIRVISHEVNNTVGGVGSAVELLGNELSSANAADADVAELVPAILTRLSGMSRFITNYADMVRLPEPNPEQTDPERFLRGVFPVLESQRCGMDIDISLEISGALSPLTFDPVLMEQVLVNVVKNSIESISSVHPADGVRGEVRIVAEDKRWTLTDNGAGIPEEVAGSLFTPFFSTKANGQGIGLMLVREILSAQGISFRLFTGDDGKTVFEIIF